MSCATHAGMLVLSGLDPISDPRADVLTSEGTELGQDAVIPNSMPGWPDTSSVVGARLCDYAVIVSSGAAPTIASDDGVFVGVRELSTTAARAVLTGAQLEPAASACTDSPTRLVVVQLSLAVGDPVAFTVELDGCQRLVDPALRPRAGSAELITLVAPAG